jgi:hypothetical protein
MSIYAVISVETRGLKRRGEGSRSGNASKGYPRGVPRVLPVTGDGCRSIAFAMENGDTPGQIFGSKLFSESPTSPAKGNVWVSAGGLSGASSHFRYGATVMSYL